MALVVEKMVDQVVDQEKEQVVDQEKEQVVDQVVEVQEIRYLAEWLALLSQHSMKQLQPVAVSALAVAVAALAFASSASLEGPTSFPWYNLLAQCHH